MTAIEVTGLTKSYTVSGGRGRRGKDDAAKTVHAVKGIDLHVEEGEILAFLGSNGAGKTTTIEILEGFRERTSGDVRVLGEDPATAPHSWREDIGVVLQESEPDSDLTARESLQFFRAAYANPRSVDEVLEIVGLTDSADQRTTKLSGGQKRRLDLATALVGDPRLIFLDEPTTGFDPSARREAWGMIENLRSVGATVLLTTHYMDEAESLSDRIVVISEGLIIANGTADDLASQVSSKTQISWDAAEVPRSALPPGLDVIETDNGFSIETDDVTAVLHALTSASTTAGTNLMSLSVTRPNLEDTFLRLTGDQSGDTA